MEDTIVSCHIIINIYVYYFCAVFSDKETELKHVVAILHYDVY